MSTPGQQQQIPGTEPEGIPEIEEAAEEYRAFRDERMQLQEKENNAQANLVAKMQARNLKSYRYQDNGGNPRKVVLSELVKAKVAKVRDSESGN